jgi:hypothetical protein
MRRGKRTGAVTAILLLISASAAVAAAGAAYSGKTSQKQPVSFRVFGSAVHNFKIIVLDKCPDGHTLRVTAGYPAMRIKQGQFGGRFVPIGGHSGEKATLRGRVAGKKVTGSLSDTSFSSRESALCRGSTRFSAKRH